MNFGITLMSLKASWPSPLVTITPGLWLTPHADLCSGSNTSCRIWFMRRMVHSEEREVLDIACNSGFWSLQCALLGADVVGFDGRPELIEQANLIRSIVGLNNLQFRVLDFWDMSPQTLGGTFDIVLNLGILYHLPKPLEALERTVLMANECVLLDTDVYPSQDSLIKLRWEEPDDIRRATRSGMIAYPSKSSIEMMLKHIGVTEWCQIPIRTIDMPSDYLEYRRATWLIAV